MTDIVERLRKQCTCPRCSSDADHMLNEGAFEIERLRSALRRIYSMGQTNVPDHWDFRVKAREIARKALEDKNDD